MLSENIQMIWNYIVANSQKSIDLLGDTEAEFLESMDGKSNSNMVVSKQVDEYYFNNESFSVTQDGQNNHTRMVSLDTTMSILETVDEDEFIVEQTRMIENLMNIVEFVLK